MKEYEVLCIKYNAEAKLWCAYNYLWDMKHPVRIRNCTDHVPVFSVPQNAYEARDGFALTEEVLNYYAKKGWHLVSVQSGEGYHDRVLYLERDI